MVSVHGNVGQTVQKGSLLPLRATWIASLNLNSLDGSSSRRTPAHRDSCQGSDDRPTVGSRRADSRRCCSCRISPMLRANPGSHTAHRGATDASETPARESDVMI